MVNANVRGRLIGTRVWYTLGLKDILGPVTRVKKKKKSLVNTTHYSDFTQMCCRSIYCALTGRGVAREEDAQGTTTQSHISPSILAHED